MKKLLISLGCLLLSIVGHAASPTTVELDVQKTVMIDVVLISSTGFNTISGAGVYIDPKGHILTVAHLFSGGFPLVIMTKTSSTTVPATLLYKNRQLDIALIKVDTSTAPTPYAEFSNSQGIHVGDPTIVVGGPWGCDFTVTRGIVSKLNVSIDLTLEPLLQTDAAISPGNSGGPVFDLDGRLMGIVTVYGTSPGGEFCGIGYAIPIDAIRAYINEHQVSNPTLEPEAH